MPRGRPKGWHHTDATKKKISLISKERTPRGKDHYNWKGGIADASRSIRKSPEYQEWRRQVFERDKYTCQMCGDNKGGNLNAHHIKGFAEYVGLRFDVDNGITYCEVCHCLVHDKPYSVRKKRRSKKKILAIRGFYKITDLGKKRLERRIPPLVLLADGLVECACGCKKLFKHFDNLGRARRFVSGHNFMPSETQDIVLRALASGPMLLAKITEISQKSYDVIKSVLSKMRKQGFVEYEKEK